MKTERFVVDVNLGKLALMLRMLGFDVVYDKDLIEDRELALISALDDRALLSRDLGLLKRKIVRRGYFVKNQLPEKQVIEVLQHFQISEAIQLGTRCLYCNVYLQEVPKSQILEKLPPKVAQFYESFYQCPECQKVYWEGTHYEHMKDSVRQWKDELTKASSRPTIHP